MHVSASHTQAAETVDLRSWCITMHRQRSVHAWVRSTNPRLGKTRNLRRFALLAQWRERLAGCLPGRKCRREQSPGAASAQYTSAGVDEPSAAMVLRRIALAWRSFKQMTNQPPIRGWSSWCRTVTRHVLQCMGSSHGRSGRPTGVRLRLVPGTPLAWGWPALAAVVSGDNATALQDTDDSRLESRVSVMHGCAATSAFSEGNRLDTFDAWMRRIHHDDLPKTLAALEACLHGESPGYNAEYRMRCKDNMWKWISARAIVVAR